MHPGFDRRHRNVCFVYGTVQLAFSDCNNGNAHWDAVRKAHVDVAMADPRGAWADTDDCNNKVNAAGEPRDDLHYTKEGYALFGRRLAHQAHALITGKKPHRKGRPPAAEQTNLPPAPCVKPEEESKS